LSRLFAHFAALHHFKNGSAGLNQAFWHQQSACELVGLPFGAFVRIQLMAVLDCSGEGQAPMKEQVTEFMCYRESSPTLACYSTLVDRIPEPHVKLVWPSRSLDASHLSVFDDLEREVWKSDLKHPLDVINNRESIRAGSPEQRNLLP
jgi:hypothetical protein